MKTKEKQKPVKEIKNIEFEISEIADISCRTCGCN